MENPKPKRDIFIIKKPNLIVSLLEGTFTFGGFIAILWFNHTYLDGNGWLDVLFIIGWLLTVASMQSSRSHRFDTAAEAITWLQSENK